MSRAKVQRHGQKVQITHQTAQRINVVKTYPILAPNGSTIVACGTGRGLHISWTGGRPLYLAARDAVANQQDHGESAMASQLGQDPESDDEALFESDDEDETNDRHDHSTIVQEIDIQLSDPVSHLAVPAEISASGSIASNNMVVAAACEDGTCYVVVLPLHPPSEASKRKKRLGVQVNRVASGFELIRAISIALSSSLASSQSSHGKDRAADNRGPSLIVAVASTDYSGKLDLYAVPVSLNGIQHRISDKPPIAFHSTYLDARPVSLDFSPAPESASRHSQLLLSDSAGHTLIYDLRPHDGNGHDTPRFVRRFSTSHSATSHSSPLLAVRKRILSAKWVFGGTAVLVLLEDGTFGLYALDATSLSSDRTQDPLGFAVEGFIGDAPEHHRGQPDAKSKKLAPMTPNTRRARSESLFTGPESHKTFTPRGTIAVFPETTPKGEPDSTIALAYNDRIYVIPSLMQLWQRHTSAIRDSSTTAGSLYGGGGGISAIDSLDLTNQAIVDINILSSRGTAGAFGLAPRDLWVTAEYKHIILARARNKGAAAERSPELDASRADQMLLDRGELGLDGMDRVLGGMSRIEPNGFTPQKRAVGFSAQ